MVLLLDQAVIWAIAEDTALLLRLSESRPLWESNTAQPMLPLRDPRNVPNRGHQHWKDLFQCTAVLSTHVARSRYPQRLTFRGEIPCLHRLNPKGCGHQRMQLRMAMTQSDFKFHMGPPHQEI